ncbi:MAG: YoaK family protein [Bacteroidales bacterium]
MISNENNTLNQLIKIWIYSVCLLSAYVNMSGFLAYAYSLSHYTGNLTYIVENLTLHYYRSTIMLLFLCISFILGGTVAALINKNKEFQLESKYGEVQFGIGIIMLLLNTVLYEENLFIYFLSFSLGVQNGLIRSYRGLGFRTTHMTATFTDLGLFIAYALRGEKDMGWKIRFEISLMISFALGTLLAILLFDKFQIKIFLFAAVGYILSGIFYFCLKQIYKKKTNTGQ